MSLLPCAIKQNDGWQTVFACDHRTVRHGAADFRHETRNGDEQRRPTGIGESSNQNVARLEIGRHGDQRGRREIDCRQTPTSVLPVRDEQTGSAGKRPRPRAELPLRASELRRHRVYRIDTAVDQPIEIPPSGPIRDEVQRPVRRPFRLED